ncbi:4a-hydroxytetrahydrobiopterin dehydratase [Brevibacillus massiliensis]|jgi:4a-hydroxytetrahydrobiopterin dehydratase|uniref:4a-hydroxytetrahydrobiopterin dehydratase n=1 Tax=Brevibacillus massiliensis TaxID=1118054 RepID=UPI0002D8FA99|nr:4a-hydroxytetrahydrobiopterin dehydratase [Brevibacillus massiliensis]
MAKLSIEQISCYLYKVPGWRLTENKQALVRTFSFPDFPSALRMVNRLADHMEGEDHLPEVNVKGSDITFTLSTGHANGLTGKDFALAQKINRLTQAVTDAV